MATPTFTLLNAGGLTDGVLTDADSNTGWNDLTTADSDIKVEGTASMSGIFRATSEQGYYDSGGAPVTAVGKVLRGWILTNNLPYMGAMGVNAYKLFCYDGSSDSNYIDIFGSDTYRGGWAYYFQDMDDFTGVTLANVDRWGVESGHGSNAKNVINTWMDVMRYMDGYSMTGGTSGDKITMVDVFGVDIAAAYGVVQEFGGVYYGTGTIQVGSGATTTYFLMDGAVFVFLETLGDCTITAGLYEISAAGTGCDCDIRNSVIRSSGAGATTRVYLDFSDTDATVNFTGNLVTRGGTVVFASGQTVTGNIFDDCGVITAGGADLSFSAVKNYEGAADSSALNWDVNTDPDAYLEGMEFTKGTASTHAIEFGNTIPTDITLTDIAFSGYSGTPSQQDSTLYFADVGGTTITLNLVGCTGNISIKTAGCTVNKVIDPVTTTFTVKDVNTLAVIEDARVWAVALDATGDLPFEQAITSISRAVSTATVTLASAHGLITGDFAFIEGATQDEYNGTFEITYVSPTVFTYTVPGTPTSPAGGTKIVTGGYFNTLTNASGIVTDTRSLGGDQPLTGHVRLGGTPYYKTGPLAATVSAASGVSQTIFLIPDS